MCKILSFFLAIFCSGFLFSVHPAHAWDASFTAGMGTVVSDSTQSYDSVAPKVGVEYMFGQPFDFEYGAMIDASVITLKNPAIESGLIIAAAGLIRDYSFADKNVFWDALLGIAPRNGWLGDSTGWVAGVGGGYRFPLAPNFSLSPHVGYRAVFVGGQTESLITVSAIFSFWN